MYVHKALTPYLSAVDFCHSQVELFLVWNVVNSENVVCTIFKTKLSQVTAGRNIKFEINLILRTQISSSHR